MIYLVTRGDDSGSCLSADNAVVEAATKGALRNTSLMVPGPSFLHAAEVLKDVPGLSIGLHVVLNAEWDQVKWGPVAGAKAVPSLVDEDGHFTQNPGILNERGFSLDEAMIEVRAQLRAARDAGLKIDYIDEHMGVGWIANGELGKRLRAFADQEGLFWHRKIGRGLPYERGGDYDPKRMLIEGVGAAEDGAAYLFVTHPGADADDMRAFGHPGLEPGQIAREREADRLAWSDPEVLAAFETRDVRPVRYIDVPPEYLTEE